MKPMFETVAIVGFVLILGLLLLPSFSGCNKPSANPVARLTGPTSVQAGQSAQYDASGSTGNIEWLVFPTRPLHVTKGATWTTNGRQTSIDFGNTPGTFYVAIVAFSGDRSDVAYLTVELTAGPNPPPPGPVTDLAKAAEEAVAKLVPADATPTAAKIADVYESLRPLEFVGRDLKYAREKTRERVRESIGMTQYQAWQPWFGEMGALLEKRKITSPREWCDCCGELAKGLRNHLSNK